MHRLPSHWTDESGIIYRFSWAEAKEHPIARVYALAFDSGGALQLVGQLGESHWWMPGGGVEPGESAEQALRRELWEELGVTIVAMARIGVWQVEREDASSRYHAFYWCQVSAPVDRWPEQESLQTGRFAPERYLDKLFWGRYDPKAARLLTLALEQERRFQQAG